MRIFRSASRSTDENEQRKYLVSAVSPVNTDPKLVPGVEITHWNGMPIDLAVARNASREAGSNEEARRARGLEALTIRWLGMSLPPDEDWVVLTYSDGQESRIPWQSVEADNATRPRAKRRSWLFKQSGDRSRREDRASSPRPEDAVQCARAQGRC